MKLQTETEITPGSFRLDFSDKIVILGSCFADSIGEKMKHAGYDVLINPFGTLYNPVSIRKAIERLQSGEQFTTEDCVEMGAGAGKWCSFSHHTSFARTSREDFLENANSSLRSASGFWQSAGKLIVTLGTARCWKHNGETVSNCLKRPGTEFTHEMLSLAETEIEIGRIASCGKECLFTVSPIRHMGDGAHINNISKATLLLATEGRTYFPAFEILLDELRDYRFYAEDLVHPSNVAVQYIWERFQQFAVPDADLPKIAANEKAWTASLHRSLWK